MGSSKRHIEEAFNDYILHAGLVGCPEIQLRETRLAWFFSAVKLLDTLITCISEGDEPTTQDIQIMEDINQELAEFLKSVR